MRRTCWLLLLFYSAQLLPAQTAKLTTVCFIINEDPNPLSERVASLLTRSIQKSKTFAPITRIEFTKKGKPIKPTLKVIIRRAFKHDVIICVGTLSTRIALAAKKIPEGIRVYTVGSLGIAHISSRTKIFDGLDRLRGGVALDVPLATAIDFSETIFRSPGPYGTIVTPTVPKHMITEAIEHAKRLDVELHVETATGATIGLKATALKKAGIKTFIKLPDLLGVHNPSRTMRSAVAEIEIMFKRNKIAIMGIGPGDVSATYCFLPSANTQAKTLFAMLEADRQSPSRPRPGIVCTASFQPKLLPRLKDTHLKTRGNTPTWLKKN